MTYGRMPSSDCHLLQRDAQTMSPSTHVDTHHSVNFSLYYIIYLLFIIILHNVYIIFNYDKQVQLSDL
jgi:hypothetical protein